MNLFIVSLLVVGCLLLVNSSSSQDHIDDLFDAPVVEWADPSALCNEDLGGDFSLIWCDGSPPTPPRVPRGDFPVSFGTNTLFKYTFVEKIVFDFIFERR